MPTGEKLFRFVSSLRMRGSFGNVTIRLEPGKVSHVKTETRRTWHYKNLPREDTARADAVSDRRA